MSEMKSSRRHFLGQMGAGGAALATAGLGAGLGFSTATSGQAAGPLTLHQVLLRPNVNVKPVLDEAVGRYNQVASA